MKADEKQARQLVRERSGGICERCCAARAAEWHHRKNRSQGGRWSADNGLDLCSYCHRYITENPLESRIHGWSVSGARQPATEPVLLGGGRVWCFLTPSGEYADEVAPFGCDPDNCKHCQRADEAAT